MNHYELLALFSGQFADSEVGRLIETIQEALTKHGSSIHYTQNLGRRKLGYPIRHHAYGTYVLVEFDADPAAIKKIDRVFKLNTDLLRHCIAKRKNIGKPIQLERHEDERRGRAPERTHKKALGEELLGEAPVMPTQPESSESANEALEKQSEQPSGAGTERHEGSTVTAEAPAARTIPSSTSDDSAVSPEEKTSSDTGPTPEESGKKKQKKATYEELDEKLNKLLSDDIL